MNLDDFHASTTIVGLKNDIQRQYSAQRIGNGSMSEDEFSSADGILDTANSSDTTKVPCFAVHDGRIALNSTF